MSEAAAVVDAILSVAHPQLWKEARRVMNAIKTEEQPDESKRAAVEAWPSAFSALQVIVNRCSIYHRDTNARKEWLDLLLTLGNYENSGVMSLRSLGFCIPYDSGSVVAMSSSLVAHGVAHVDGDRVCVAFIMSDKIHSRFGAPCPSWAK